MHDQHSTPIEGERNIDDSSVDIALTTHTRQIHHGHAEKQQRRDVTLRTIQTATKTIEKYTRTHNSTINAKTIQNKHKINNSTQ